MAKDPQFEIKQVEAYIDHLAQDPRQLGDTVETHFFPVLQKIFFYRAYEVRRDVEFEGRRFPFDCVDVLGGRRRTLVHFAYTQAQKSVLPYFALEWGRDTAARDCPTLLVIQNRAMDASLDAVRAQRSHWVSALDFDGLKAFAREGFEAQKTREGAFYPRLMRDAMEALAVEVARQNIDLEALEWRDLERLLAAVFQGLGYRCILTPGSKDGGRDLVLCDITQDDVAWYNIELKHWRGRSVGDQAVRYCLEAALREGRRGALLISTGGVGPAALTARTEVHRDYMRLAGENKVVTTCRHFLARRSGLWMKETPVRSVLFEETL